MTARGRFAWIASATVAALALAFGWLLWRTDPPASAVAADSPLPPAERIVAQAQIVPIDGIIEVRPLASGRVLRVLVHPGDRVQTDQLLAEVESDLQSAAVRQRRAELEAASQRLKLTAEGVRPEEQGALSAAAEAARNEAEIARDRWQRERKLHEEGFISEQVVITAERELQAAQARLGEAEMRARAALSGGRPQEIKAAREQVASASAAVTEGKVALSRTRIVAPIAGVVMTRNVNPGDVIGSDVTSPTLFRLVDPDRIEVRFEVEESLAPAVTVGLPVQLTLPGKPTVVGRGRVTRIAPQVEKRSIGADDARIRADSLVRPAWCDFVPEPGIGRLPVNYRLEARVTLQPDSNPRP